MKNIQVIDGADNSRYDIFSATEEEFTIIFPGDTDIEFVEDFFDRVGEEKAIEITEAMWRRPIEKTKVQGIHGTLFYELADKKREFYPRKRSDDIPS